MNPAWYRSFFDELTVDFWCAAATTEWTLRDVELAWRELELRPGSRVLDCPCGHGRHAVELARRGCQVTGVDISTYGLELAQRAAQEAAVTVDFRHGDMLDLENVPAVDAAITLGNAFGYVDYEGMSRFTRSVGQALRPGGRWLIDTGAVAESILPNVKPELEFDIGGFKTRIRNRYLIDQSCLESTFDFTRNGQSETRRSYHFVFTVAEIRRLLAAAGLTIRALYGGAAGEEYQLGSHWLIIAAEKPRG